MGIAMKETIKKIIYEAKLFALTNRRVNGLHECMIKDFNRIQKELDAIRTSYHKINNIANLLDTVCQRVKLLEEDRDAHLERVQELNEEAEAFRRASKDTTELRYQNIKARILTLERAHALGVKRADEVLGSDDE